MKKWRHHTLFSSQRRWISVSWSSSLTRIWTEGPCLYQTFRLWWVLWILLGPCHIRRTPLVESTHICHWRCSSTAFYLLIHCYTSKEMVLSCLLVGCAPCLSCETEGLFLSSVHHPRDCPSWISQLKGLCDLSIQPSRFSDGQLFFIYLNLSSLTDRESYNSYTGLCFRWCSKRGQLFCQRYPFSPTIPQRLFQSLSLKFKLDQMPTDLGAK